MRSIKRTARSPAAWVWLASALLLAGCEDGTPQQATPIQPGNLTQITSADGSSVSFNETGGAVTVGSTTAPQSSAQCSPDGKYVMGNTIYLDFAEQAVNREIDQVKRTLDDVTSRIEQCKGKAKGLPEYDAQLGCDRMRLRQQQARLTDLKTNSAGYRQNQAYHFPKETAALRTASGNAYHARAQAQVAATPKEMGLALLEYKQAEDMWNAAQKALNDAIAAKEQAAEAEKRSIEAELARLAPICEQAETAYEQNPCNNARLASDAFTRNRAQQQLAALEAKRTLLKDCRKDQERPAGGSSGMGSPAAQELLRQTLPGIIGGFGPRKPPPHQPPKDTTRQPDQPKTPPQPHWHDEKKH